MTTIAVPQSQSQRFMQAGWPGLSTLKLWLARHRQRHQLQELNVDQLQDIGKTREAAEREAMKPFWRA